MGRFDRGAMGSQHYLGSVGEIAQVNRVGTVGHLGSLAGVGTLRYLGTAGRVQYVNRLGTVGELRTIGTLGRARPSIAKRLLGTNALHTAAGSHYPGSWEDISQFRTKTYSVWSSQHGSLYIITGALGTYQQGLTGTTYSVQLPSGSFEAASFTEVFQWARAIIRIGSTGSGKGTVRLARNFQV